MRTSAIAAAALLAGCALTSRPKPVEIRYFSPASQPPGAAGAPARQALAGAPRLRLGRVTSSAHLRSRIVYRTSKVELAAYDQRRWTDEPEVYLRRSISRALFDERPLTEAVSGPAPTLDLELLGFEEVRRGDARSGRVELHYTLHDEDDVLASGRVDVERPASTASMEDVVGAIAAALDEASSEVAGVVAARVRSGGGGDGR